MTIERHVIVGGGHFVERGGQLVQELAERGPRLVEAFQRGTEYLTIAEHVPVGVPRVPTYTQIQTMQERSRLPVIFVEANEGNDNNWFDRGDAGGAQGPDRGEALQTSIEAWNEALLAGGSAAAGDFESALDHGAQAAEKWWEGFSGTFKDLFGN